MPRFHVAGLFIVAGCLLAGCSVESKPTPGDASATSAVAPKAAPANSGASIAPIGSGAAGGLTPVTGAENIGAGTGGGIANAAKERARAAAAKAGAGSAASSDE